MIRAGARALLDRPLLTVGASWRRLRRARRWLLLLAGTGWLTLLGVLLLPEGSPPRVALVFGFALTCPGWAVCLLLPVREAAERWVLAVALSMSLAILVNTALTVISNGSILLRLTVLALITTIAALTAALTCPADAAAAGSTPPREAEW